ncbi:MAG TPA: P-II family nitrogen regulator [Anaerovoracaceae bacterium]|nr:P-II family nitrogen regulator [Anaerovoracaceae bacterium]
MQNNEMKMSFELICSIVDCGMGSKVLKALKNHGITGGTILVGRGTVDNKILTLLAITDSRKEVVLSVTNTENVTKALESINDEFKLGKKNHGIIFSTSICIVEGSSNCKCSGKFNDNKGADKKMYQMITVIVDKGKGEDVISASNMAGSKGGTIINGRGSGVHETSKVFSMEIEPEKEVVILLCKTEKTEKVVNKISEVLNLDEPGNGIIYVQNVNETYGILD